MSYLCLSLILKPFSTHLIDPHGDKIPQGRHLLQLYLQFPFCLSHSGMITVVPLSSLLVRDLSWSFRLAIL